VPIDVGGADGEDDRALQQEPHSNPSLAVTHLASAGERTGESVRHAKIDSLDRLRGRASIETTTGPGADHGINPGLVIALQGALNLFDQIDD
jgi:hypothetical protein